MLSESQGDWFNLHWLNMTQYHQSKLQSCSLPAFLCLFRQKITSFEPGTYPELQDNGSFAIYFKWVEMLKFAEGLRINDKGWNTSKPMKEIYLKVLYTL